jgi:glycosyltransferase involved in cell wall biosynthesis
MTFVKFDRNELDVPLDNRLHNYDFAKDRPSAPTGAVAASLRQSACANELVSLVVTTINRVQELARLFRSLAKQHNSSFEVVLVDQNQDDRLAALIAYYASCFPIRHLRSLPGLSKSRNVGLFQCRGEIIGFPDDDCWYLEDTIDRVIAIFRTAADVEVISGRTIDKEGVESLGQFQNFSSRITRSNLWRTHNSSTLFVRARALQAVCGFDESLGLGAKSQFQSGEETDLLLKVMQRGGQAQFYRDLTIFHDQIPSSSSAMLRRAKSYSPGFGRLLRKHNFGFPYLAFRVARTCGGAARAALRMNSTEARYKIAWALGTIQGYFAKPNS